MSQQTIMPTIFYADTKAQATFGSSGYGSQIDHGSNGLGGSPRKLPDSYPIMSAQIVS